ncbi:SNAP receptor USE1 KNAG_0F02240 [Huiozyma naganishii CBS 8797]|uniref:Uncharacterized protein n=1 Tax=Huiozyma naganishii (strain ATCC MYA-139 / BCRC 22969 / CBS 8797 / KCTC 17520 / NBRC 10181 / NCYC 3082 / Yp74L-3) TaxID=1071383 RepID=J7S8F2_HUIN7|nr:hypothetical protein KNAG_0F02240 [Kazachstania naganishii CBS 8797]CCK70891.1 hypothetical protein KNAG_0F02240 [Kazachstania naganishii CBS 8797]
MASVQSSAVQQWQEVETCDNDLLAFVLNSKFKSNLTQLRHDTVGRVVQEDDRAALREYQETFPEMEFKSSCKAHQLLKDMQEQYEKYQQSQKVRTYSVDFDKVPDEAVGARDPASVEGIEEPVEGDDDEIHQMRRRLLARRRSSGSDAVAEETFDQQLEVNENVQDNLIQDMTKLVGSLKQGAVAFQTALEEDQRVLGAAEIGIQVASKGIQDISGKLSKYDKSKLSWMFYISVTVFMILGLGITFVIIKLFPAL